MARPGPDIIKQIEDDKNVTWEVIEYPQVYIITYDGKPVGIRRQASVMAHTQFKYKRMLYSNSGNASLEVRRLNKRFKTDRFGYMVIG